MSANLAYLQKGKILMFTKLYQRRGLVIRVMFVLMLVPMAVAFLDFMPAPEPPPVSLAGSISIRGLVFYVSDEPPAIHDLILVNVNEENTFIRQNWIRVSTGGEVSDPRMGRDGRIYFLSTSPYGVTTLYSVGSDGSGLKELTVTNSLTPSWHMDEQHHQLAVLYGQPPYDGVRIIDLNTNQVIRDIPHPLPQFIEYGFMGWNKEGDIAFFWGLTPPYNPRDERNYQLHYLNLSDTSSFILPLKPGLKGTAYIDHPLEASFPMNGVVTNKSPYHRRWERYLITEIWDDGPIEFISDPDGQNSRAWN